MKIDDLITESDGGNALKAYLDMLRSAGAPRTLKMIADLHTSYSQKEMSVDQAYILGIMTGHVLGVKDGIQDDSVQEVREKND